MHKSNLIKLLTDAAIIVPIINLIFILPVFIFFQPWIIRYEYKKNSLNVDPLAVQTVLAFKTTKTTAFLDQLDFFGPQEQAHLLDVYRLLFTAKVLFLVSVTCLGLISFWLFRSHQSQQLIRGLLIAGCLSLGIILVSGVFLITSWDTLFINFHRIFFPQGNWAFPANSTLINLFPDWFWFDVFGYYITIITGLSLGLIASSYIFKSKPNM